MPRLLGILKSELHVVFEINSVVLGVLGTRASEEVLRVVVRALEIIWQIELYFWGEDIKILRLHYLKCL